MITVSTWQENDRVAVAIKDNCLGIKPEQMEHIFSLSTPPSLKSKEPV